MPDPSPFKEQPKVFQPQREAKPAQIIYTLASKGSR